MIDVHCHILPQIDDGPFDIGESIAMAETAYRDGIRTIVATPHVKDTLPPAAMIQNAVDRLNRRLVDLAIPVTVLRGADVSALLDPSALKDYTIAGTSYILIEFPHSHLPKNAGKILFALALRGFRPIITHPERNPSVIESPSLLLDLLSDRSCVQITAGSLEGLFGQEVQECAAYLLKMRGVDIIATDAHSNEQRRPVLSEGLRVAEKIIGRERASRLVTTNPEAVIQGRPLDAP